MSEEKKDFVIKDRRFFGKENQEQEKKEDKGRASSEKAKEREKKEAAATMEADAETQLPEINFATFIFSLNSSVLVQLGIIEDPATGKKVKNLPMAKQTIDILAMLEEKTRGNLTKEEESMLKNILYDLRILYVKEKR